MRNKRVNDVYEEWKTGKGFFHYLYYYFAHASPEIECEFLNSENDALLLDMKYHGGFSGRKNTSTFLDNYLEDIEDSPDTVFVKFAEVFWKLNSENILREWEIVKAQYNPLNNYDMTEDFAENRVGANESTTNSGSETHNTGTDTTTTTTDTETITGQGSGDSYVSEIKHRVNGFDSASTGDGVNADSTTTKDYVRFRTNPNEENKTELEHGLNVESSGVVSTGGTSNDATEHHLTRSGNIGVTTSTQMLEQHKDFWWKWNFYNSILFPSVDKLLTIPLY